MKPLIRPLLCLALPALLLSCGTSSNQEGGSSQSEAASSSSHEEVVVSSAKDALKVLNARKNYTLAFASSSGKAHYYFTPSSIGFAVERRSASIAALIEDEGGIYRLSYDGGMLGGEYLLGEDGAPIHDLYSCPAQVTLYGVSTGYVDSLDPSLTTLKVADKSYRMAFMMMLGYSRGDYVNLDSLEVNVDEKGAHFTLTYKGKPTVYDLIDVESTVDPNVTSFLSNGGKALELSDSLKTMRRYMRGNNFTRDIYDLDTQGVTGQEVFTENYFYSTLSQNGAMAFDNPDAGLVGVYYFSLVNGEISFLGRPMYEKPDVVEYYHYPTYMTLFDHMEYLHEGELGEGDYDYVGEAYTVFDEATILSFVTNNSLDQVYPVTTCVPYALGVDVDVYESGEDSTITFVYYFEYQGELITMPFPFSKFGCSNIPSLDKVYDYYQHATPNTERK